VKSRGTKDGPAIKQARYIFMVVNLDDNHWFLLYADRQSLIITSYDPFMVGRQCNIVLVHMHVGLLPNNWQLDCSVRLRG
jgi:hypothetical protein